MTSIVKANGLVKRYDGTLAVAGVDLDIAEGEIFGLVGPDGFFGDGLPSGLGAFAQRGVAIGPNQIVGLTQSAPFVANGDIGHTSLCRPCARGS